MRLKPCSVTPRDRLRGVRRFAYYSVSVLSMLVVLGIHALTVLGCLESWGVLAGIAAFIFVGLSDLFFFIVSWHRFGLANGITALWVGLTVLGFLRFLLE